MGWSYWIAWPITEQYGWGLAQIPWKCLQTGHRCGEFLVSANPLIFNGICFDIAFPTRNNFISLLLKDSLFFCRLIYLMGSFSVYPPLEELVVLKGPYFVFVLAVVQALSLQILLASWMSLGMIVTRLVWIEHRLVSSNNPTKYASEASWSTAMARDWNLTLPHRGEVITLWSPEISRTSHWKGSFLIKSSVDFWYLQISFKATVPGRNLWSLFTAFGAFIPFFFAALAAFAACASCSAAFFFARVFLSSSCIIFRDPVLCPGFKAGLLPLPVVFLGPGGSIPRFGSGRSPVELSYSCMGDSVQFVWFI